MENDPLIGEAIKRLRQNRNMTIEEVSTATGVSRSMLSQIERGVSSPTVSVLWKISSGLRIPFSDLLSHQSTQQQILELDKLTPVLESGGKMILYNLFPFNPITGFEYFYIIMEPSAQTISDEHRNAFLEYIIVTKGTLVIKAHDRDYVLKAPCGFSFRPDSTHVYSNPYGETAEFQNIVKY